MIGKTLLHYEIIEKLGEGGMGEVYRARDTKLGREVAIKILPEDMYRDADRRNRFEREARVIAALNHPNIVTVHSVEEFEHRPFLTMELVKGTTLRDEITGGGTSLGTFFSVAVPLVDAVCSAHAQGITHRDLKPANVMISDEGRLKVLDFGLAKLFQEAQEVDDAKTMGPDIDTQDGRIMGTVSYMSPEQVEGKGLDGRSDIFSLGVLFYEMLTGQRPFSGDSNATTISAILRDTPPPVTEIRENLPRHLGRIIRRCLAKVPDRRYQSAVDLRNDMQELAEEVDSGDVAVSEGTASHSAMTSGSTTGSVSGARRPITSDSIVLPGKKRTYGWVLGVLGLVVVAAVVTGIVKSRSTGDPEVSTSAAALSANATLGVIGFENLTDPEDSENLGRVLMGLVTTGLAESGGLNVASTAKVLAARREVGAGDRAFDASLAPAAARSAGADVMLVGQVIRDGERMILTAELVDVGSGNAMGSMQKEAASNSELFELAGAIARDVRELMGVTTAGAVTEDEFDLAKSLTDSPEAYRQYTAGEVALNQARYDQAVERFNQAIRIDSSFALAYSRLGLATSWNGETEKGLDALKRGLPYIERLPEEWQVIYRADIGYHDGNIEPAYESLTRLIESSSKNLYAYYLLGELATHFPKYRDPGLARKCFERTLEIDPTFEVSLFHLALEYLLVQDNAAVEDLIARYRRADPSDPRVHNLEVALWYAQGKFDQVIARVEELLQAAPNNPSGRQYLGWALEMTGDWERAYEWSNDAVDRRPKGYLLAFAFDGRARVQIGRGNFEAAFEDWEAAIGAFTELGLGASDRWYDAVVAYNQWYKSYVLLEAGDAERAVKAARRSVEFEPDFTLGYLALMQAQLRAASTEEAKATVRELKKVKERNRSPIDDFQLLLAQAELEMAQGKADAALESLRRAEALSIENRNPWIQWWIEGAIKSEAGDIDGAIASYQKVFEPGSFLLPVEFDLALLRIPVHYKLARLLEESGQLAEAKHHYEAYLERWGNADIVIPNVDDARARLQKLEL